MDNALARLHKAEEDVAALREAIKAAQAKARATPKKRKKGEEDMSASPCFEVSAEERAYKGDPNDRKQIVKHRQRMKVRVILIAGKGQVGVQRWLRRAYQQEQKLCHSRLCCLLLACCSSADAAQPAGRACVLPPVIHSRGCVKRQNLSSNVPL